MRDSVLVTPVLIAGSATFTGIHAILNSERLIFPS
jgi:hypothetical protein